MFPLDEFLNNYAEIHAAALGFTDGFKVTLPENFGDCPEDICPKGEDRWYFKGFQIVGWIAKWGVLGVLIKYGIVEYVLHGMGV